MLAEGQSPRDAVEAKTEILKQTIHVCAISLPISRPTIAAYSQTEAGVYARSGAVHAQQTSPGGWIQDEMASNPQSPLWEDLEGNLTKAHREHQAGENQDLFHSHPTYSLVYRDSTEVFLVYNALYASYDLNAPARIYCQESPMIDG